MTAHQERGSAVFVARKEKAADLTKQASATFAAVFMSPSAAGCAVKGDTELEVGVPQCNGSYMWITRG